MDRSICVIASSLARASSNALRNLAFSSDSAARRRLTASSLSRESCRRPRRATACSRPAEPASDRPLAAPPGPISAPPVNRVSGLASSSDNCRCAATGSEPPWPGCGQREGILEPIAGGGRERRGILGGLEQFRLARRVPLRQLAHQLEQGRRSAPCRWPGAPARRPGAFGSTYAAERRAAAQGTEREGGMLQSAGLCRMSLFTRGGRRTGARVDGRESARRRSGLRGSRCCRRAR